MASLRTAEPDRSPRDPDVERNAIAELLVRLATLLNDSDAKSHDTAQAVVRELSIDLKPYSSGVGPTSLSRLMYCAEIEGVVLDAELIDGALVERGFTVAQLPIGKPPDGASFDSQPDGILEAHNDAGVFIWLAWTAGIDKINVRIELPPATYAPATGDDSASF